MKALMKILLVVLIVIVMGGCPKNDSKLKPHAKIGKHVEVYRYYDEPTKTCYLVFRSDVANGVGLAAVQLRDCTRSGASEIPLPQ